jgi:small subunit ribosomal protein S8
MNLRSIQFLNCLKNAANRNKEVIQFSYSKCVYRLVKVLYQAGYLQSYKFLLVKNSNNQIRKEILVYLRYYYDKSTLHNLQVVSCPSYSRFLEFRDVLRINETKSTFFFSTSKGILTAFECKKKRIGGILFFLC